MLSRLSWKLHLLRHGLKNLWRFRKVVWHFDTGDYEPLLRMMQFATRLMSNDMKRGHLVGSNRYARQLLVVSELCRRLADDDYYMGHYNIKDAKGFRRHYDKARYRAKYDAFYLGRMFRHVQYWWD